MFRSLKKFFQKTTAFFRDIDSSKTLIKMASYAANMVDKETSTSTSTLRYFKNWLLTVALYLLSRHGGQMHVWIYSGADI